MPVRVLLFGPGRRIRRIDRKGGRVYEETKKLLNNRRRAGGRIERHGRGIKRVECKKNIRVRSRDGDHPAVNGTRVRCHVYLKSSSSQRPPERVSQNVSYLRGSWWRVCNRKNCRTLFSCKYARCGSGEGTTNFFFGPLKTSNLGPFKFK